MKQLDNMQSLALLVNSLTKAEKRYFRLYGNLQKGEKAYISLFDLIDKQTDLNKIDDLFKKEQPGKSLDVAKKHLYRTIMDCLLHLQEGNDVQYDIVSSLSKADILFKRNLFEEAFIEINKAKKLAKVYESDVLSLLVRRTELKHHRTVGFEGLSERDLVSMHMKVNEVMKYMRSTNLHLQLYDVLKHRLTYKGYVRSDKQKDDLNDLVLSELNLMANGAYRGVEVTKLHLLFQAAYYLNCGNYKSAIRFYEELIDLFEQNEHLMSNPPIYYLSAIQGVLDSLCAARLYEKMPYFIAKLKDLGEKDYTTEFIQEVQARTYLYRQVGLAHTGDYAGALHLMEESRETLFKKMALIDLDVRIQLHLSCAILYLLSGNLKEARKNMKNILGNGKLFCGLPSYRIARLVNLLIQAESGNYLFLESEVASIKRSIRGEKVVYGTEKLIFKYVMAYPLPSYQKARALLMKRFRKEIEKVRQDKYDLRLLKTFDFILFIENRLNN